MTSEYVKNGFRRPFWSLDIFNIFQKQPSRFGLNTYTRLVNHIIGFLMVKSENNLKILFILKFSIKNLKI
jgi:hypothetical protein